MEPTKVRNLALDVFRGMTVTLMIIVNTPGNGATTFAPLQHASWNGFTPTDLVFPSFLFAVGNAMLFALPKYELMGRKAVLWKILKRTCIIFLLGYLMYWFPFFAKDGSGQWGLSPVSDTRIMGVLQRIALGYGFGSLVLIYLKERGALIFSVLALLVYWGVLMLFGDLTLEGNAVLQLDKALLGTSHLYTGYTSKVFGAGFSFDPEGILSTLPAIVNVIAGYLTARFIQAKGYTYETIAKMCLVGVSLLFIAYWWNMVFPINKPIWSSSYVLNTVGLDLLILAILVYIIEILQKRDWTYFFEVFGRNTLFIYLVSELLLAVVSLVPGVRVSGIFTGMFQPLFGDYMGSFMFAICYMLVCWLVGWVLDKRKIYIKV